MEAELQVTFRALSDPTRRAILMHLHQGDMTIGEVTDKFDITRAAIKKHLTILEQGKVISVQTSGRERINHLEPMALKPVSEWINFFSAFWDEHLTKLQQTIKQKEQK